ncbi:MAG TPA: DUF2520 domain-containing protein [Chloroflexota bacterium]|nr:DUF2520 domain-containing protein [Chloroflexota bacterium]
MTDLPRVAFVGAGRLAGALAPALADAGYPMVAVASRRIASAETLASRLPGARAAASASEAAAAAELVFLSVPDDAVAQVAAGITWRSGMSAVHCSGVAGLELLAPAAQQGAAVGSFHPLQTFAGHKVSLAGVTVAIEAASELSDALERMARRLACQPLRLPEGAKPLYHASAALASNYLITLLGQAARLWQCFGYSDGEALAALLPLAKTTLSNVEQLGLARALTGPVARGDAGTLRKHLQALRAHAPDLVLLYRALAEDTLPLTSLSPETATELHHILQTQETQPCA